MAELLYRLGKLSARRAWAVIGSWLGILALAIVGFVVGFGGLSNSFDIPGTASSEVIDELAAELPDYAGAAGTVVFHTTDDTPFTDAQEQAISDLVADADGLPDVAEVVDPFATEQERADRVQQVEDGRAQIDAGRTQLDQAKQQLVEARAGAEAMGAPAETLAGIDAQLAAVDDQRAQLEAQAAELEQGAELLELSSDIRLVSEDGTTALVNVAFTEPRLELAEESKHAVIDHFEGTPIDGVEVAFSTEIAQGVPQIFGFSEVVGLALALAVLLVMLRTLVTALLPVATAIVGVAIGVLSTLALSGVITMASVTPVLGVMLGLAVGIDYSLFIINRHRKQLLQGAEVVESIGLANGTSGNAVVFAGATVIVALLALNVTGIPFLGLMGNVGAICVGVAVLIAVSLTPALLGLVGERALSRRARARVQAAATGPADATTASARPVRPMNTWRAVATIVLSITGLLVIAAPTASLRLGLPDGGSEPHESTTYQAYTLIADKFGAGANSPLLVTADLPEGTADDEVLTLQLDIARVLAEQDDVVAVAPIAVSDDNALAAFQVIPAEGPNSESTEQLVKDLRVLPPVNGDIELGVAGQAAINIDISERLGDILPLYLSVVVGLSVLIMIVVFRSLLVPLLATGGFILSLLATYGALVAVFQWGWLSGLFGIPSTGPILSFLPVILVGILFGLAMDYQLFLASGMREAYVHGSPARLAVTQGFRAGRSVVIAAGAIMVAVFGGFIFSESVIIRALGFGLAVGVLLDAFVVRLLLMPAVMHLVGRGAWWLPKWLGRIIPNVDVEGAALERRHHAAPHVAAG